jgi:hypothetical protein
MADRYYNVEFSDDESNGHMNLRTKCGDRRRNWWLWDVPRIFINWTASRRAGGWANRWEIRKSDETEALRQRRGRR